MYALTERLLSFNWQRFTLHKNEKRNLELYRKIPSSTNLLNYPHNIHAHIFAEKIWVAFAFAKATHIFSANTCELDTVLSRTVNI